MFTLIHGRSVKVSQVGTRGKEKCSSQRKMICEDSEEKSVAHVEIEKGKI